LPVTAQARVPVAQVKWNEYEPFKRRLKVTVPVNHHNCLNKSNWSKFETWSSESDTSGRIELELQFCFGWLALYCTDTNSGISSQAAPHERSLGGFFVHPVPPYIFSIGTIARAWRGHCLNLEARAASGSQGFEPGLVVAFAVTLPTVIQLQVTSWR
jgi:hypothetical protein